MAVWQSQVSSKLLQEEEAKHMREAIQAHREHIRNMEKSKKQYFLGSERDSYSLSRISPQKLFSGYSAFGNMMRHLEKRLG